MGTQALCSRLSKDRVQCESSPIRAHTAPLPARHVKWLSWMGSGEARPESAARQIATCAPPHGCRLSGRGLMHGDRCRSAKVPAHDVGAARRVWNSFSYLRRPIYIPLEQGVRRAHSAAQCPLLRTQLAQAEQADSSTRGNWVAYPKGAERTVPAHPPILEHHCQKPQHRGVVQRCNAGTAAAAAAQVVPLRLGWRAGRCATSVQPVVNVSLAQPKFVQLRSAVVVTAIMLRRSTTRAAALAQPEPLLQH